MPKSDNYVNIDIIEPIVIFIKNFKMAVKMAKQKNKFVVRKKYGLKTVVVRLPLVLADSESLRQSNVYDP